VPSHWRDPKREAGYGLNRSVRSDNHIASHPRFVDFFHGRVTLGITVDSSARKERDNFVDS